jgi:hypothetical protein
VLVVDDGTRDPRSRKLLARLPRWVTLVSKENGGPGLARNLGIARCTGELVLTLDDDDRLRPDALELLEQALLAAPHASFAYGHVRYFGAQRGTAVVPRFNGYLELFDNRLMVTALFRRSIFSAFFSDDREEGVRYPEGPWGLEDWGLWLDCASRGLQAAVVEAPLLHYRRKGSAGLLHGTTTDRPALVAKLRAHYPALFTPEGLAALKARDAPSLEVLCTRPAAEASLAAQALAAAQGLPDVRAGRAPGTARALLLEARGKYLLCCAPALARALSRRGPLLARAITALEAHPERAWARFEGTPSAAALLRTERLGGLLQGDLASGDPAEALTEAAQRLLPGLALQAAPDEPGAAEPQETAAALPTGLDLLTGYAKERASAAARGLWRGGRGAVERLLGAERVGRALHPLKLRAQELAPSLQGAARALRERRLPHGLGRLVPPSVREERAMLDALPVGGPSPLAAAPDPAGELHQR